MCKFKLLISFLLVLLLFSPAAFSITDPDDLLHADEAFAISGHAKGPDTVRVKWKIADGYYMYQSKIRFNSATDDVQIGSVVLPGGITKEDPVFGSVEVYRDQVEIDVPLVRTNRSEPQTLTLQTVSQGCADMGVCYPPHRQSLLIELPAGESIAGATPSATTEFESAQVQPLKAPANDNPLSDLTSLGDDLGLQDDGVLSVEEAYKLGISLTDDNKLKLFWIIADGTYLYADKFRVTVKQPSDVKLGAYAFPEPEIKKDTITPEGEIGDVAIYHSILEVEIPLIRGAGAENVTIEVAYQGCAERGICYPPVTESFDLTLPAISEAEAIASQAASSAVQQRVTATAASDEPLSETDTLIKFLSESSIWLVLLTFFAIGLGLSLTPCVFPMIPILSGIIAGHGDKITAAKGFMLSVIYVFSMAMLYTIAGVIAGLTGANLQIIFQEPWILASFAGVFGILALSMFGFFELQLPASLQSRLTELSNRQEGGSYAGVAIMGFLSALIVGPCVAPPLAAVLIFLSQEGDPVMGGLTLFVMSLGMGVPLLLLGASAGKLLPKAGAWMDTVKAVFGVMMLAVGIWMLSRIVPTYVSMTLWATLLIVSGIYMGAIQNLPENVSGWHKLWKGLGYVLLLYGTLILIGTAAGNRDLLQPLKGLGGGTHAEATEHLVFKSIKTSADLDRELAAAKAAGKPVMLDFYADWCISCIEMEKFTFSDKQVQQALDKFVVLQADVTANDEDDKALLNKRFGLPGPPAIMFWDAAGNEKRALRVVGFKPADQFVDVLKQISP